MANDLVERLKRLYGTHPVVMDAATHIESQDKRIEALEGALWPFTVLAIRDETVPDNHLSSYWVSAGAIRAAKLVMDGIDHPAALSGTTPAPDALGSGESGNG